MPFLIALGFANSALTVYPMERFGAISAYSIVAAGFTAIGLFGAIAVGVVLGAALQRSTGGAASAAVAGAALSELLFGRWPT